MEDLITQLHIIRELSEIKVFLLKKPVLKVIEKIRSFWGMPKKPREAEADSLLELTLQELEM